MREIKFRAWDRDSKQWIIQLVLRQSGEPMFYHPSENKTISISSLTKPAIDISFYTGLKDKNGKEIYEGDILAIDGKISYEIKWNPEVSGYDFFQHGLPVMGAFGLYQKNFVFQVIGNIYENPELLEASKNG